MPNDLLFWALLLAPLLTGGAAALQPSPRRALGVMLAGATITLIAGFTAVANAFVHGSFLGAGGWFHIDALSAYNLGVMLLVYGLSSAYAWVYFTAEIRAESLPLNRARMFAGLWCAALSAMTLVLISNNLGIMWVGIETTTLLTAFLICVHQTRESLEAMWKYLLICSVGVAFAFMGTLLIAAAGRGLKLESDQLLLWTEMLRHADGLNPMFVKAAFIFLLVGYGTKAGLAPMHNWLPDAHSQAPAPVSAVFSGFLLNSALYCIMRFIPIVERATGGEGWSLQLLIVIGLLSILVAAAFIIKQHDAKRLLAYSSVEHLGIITLGLGLGGLGTFWALFHTLNHSLCKSLAFFSAGRLGQFFGTHDLMRLSGAKRRAFVWGLGLFVSLLALLGMAPFAIFLSELQILKAALDNHATVAAILFLAGMAMVFAGALRYAISLAWGPIGTPGPPIEAAPLEVGLVVLPLAIVLLLGLWMPAPLGIMLERAADVIRDTGPALTASIVESLP